MDQSPARPTSLPSPAPGTALYVHLPFCAAKCTYCDFFSVPAAGQDLEGTLETVLAEARARAPLRPTTLFIGGGTPSLYPTWLLTRFLDELDGITGWRGSATEATVECNPESLDERKAEALLQAGIDRLSIGFQSLDDQRLASFGRVHDVRQSFTAFRAARAAGVRRLNVDLIYAAPGQSTAQWRRELDRVLDLGPDHLSAYNLTVEPGTAYERMHARGEVSKLDEEEELEQFFLARERCTAYGLVPYEVSNYARPGEECRHNLNYWENGEYVGIGPSAVSKVGETRFGNPRSLASWRTLVREGGPPAWSERLRYEARLGETWWLGLRLARGLTPAEARRRARAKPAGRHTVPQDTAPRDTAPGDTALRDTAHVDAAQLVAAELVDLGLIERDEGVTLHDARHRLTQRGLALADAVGRRFLVSDTDGVGPQDIQRDPAGPEVAGVSTSRP